MNSQDPTELLTPDERKLYELMSEISEDCYFAGWMVGNEYTLWSSIQTGEMRYGMSDIDRDLLAQVAALAVKTGCWIVWRDYKDGLPRNDSSTWGPYAIPLVEWNAIYEAKNDMRPERATQPAQRKSQIDIHWITCEEARKIGGGLIDKIPADDVTALGRAIYQRILDSAPAKNQVAAVRAVPEGWKSVPPRPNHNMLDALYGHAWMDKSPSEQIGLIQAYRNMLDAATLKLPPVAAPSPQPELSGSIYTSEFQNLLETWWHAKDGTIHQAHSDLIRHINQWKDAECAVAREEARRDVHETNVTCVNNMLKAQKRATDAEAKLAAIREGADIRVKYADYFATIERAQDCLRKLAEFKLSEPVTQPQAQEPVKLMTMQEVIDAMREKELLTDLGCSALLNGDYIHATLEYITQIINYVALAQRTSTPSQGDTSGLPG